jgi:hypothetical protein
MTTLLRFLRHAWRSVRELDDRTALRERVRVAIR